MQLSHSEATLVLTSSYRTWRTPGAHLNNVYCSAADRTWHGASQQRHGGSGGRPQADAKGQHAPAALAAGHVAARDLRQHVSCAAGRAHRVSATTPHTRPQDCSGAACAILHPSKVPLSGANFSCRLQRRMQCSRHTHTPWRLRGCCSAAQGQAPLHCTRSGAAGCGGTP
jgi:hypothetical protein